MHGPCAPPPALHMCLPAFPFSVSMVHSTPATMTYLLVFSSWQLLCSSLPQHLCRLVCSPVNALTAALCSVHPWGLIWAARSGNPYPQPHQASETRLSPAVTCLKHYQMQESNSYWLSNIPSLWVKTCKNKHSDCLLLPFQPLAPCAAG